MAFALNALVGITAGNAFQALMNYVINQVLPTLIALIISPFTNPEMLWTVAPLIITMTLMQLYFARHKEEENSMDNLFGNSLLLIFVSINLLQYIYNKGEFNEKLILVIIIGIISALQAILNYYHLIQKKIAFILNSELSSNTIAYLAIILVYTNIPLSITTLIASVILVGLIVAFFNYVMKKIPMTSEARKYYRELKINQDKEKLAEEKANLRNENAFNARTTDAGIAFVIIILTIIISFTLSLWLNLLIQGIVYLLTALFLMKKRGLKLSSLNYSGKINQWLKGALFGFILFFVISGLLYLLPPLNTQSFGIELLIPSLITALGSELLFRGVIQRSLKAGMGYHAGINIQALMFTITGISTSPLLSLILVYISGIVLGYMREEYGLESSISAHLVFNLIGCLV